MVTVESDRRTLQRPDSRVSAEDATAGHVVQRLGSNAAAAYLVPLWLAEYKMRLHENAVMR